MHIPNRIKLVIVCVLLFGAIAVDFANKIMSIGFDLFFIGFAIWVAYPLAMKSLESDGSKDV